MSYQALYRRLRPQRFEDVVGQDHIVKTLKNQIENNRINHAYLFCGTRGTGKTTTAKIFARAINCNGGEEKPCNKCDVCSKILKGTSVNVIEIDAASNNGVDNIRDIIEEVKYPPTDCKYKVYIIDEVHMLSGGAFNALLKTLEEPPSYVVFILATTDPQKMPVTVLSRCQRFDFHRISKDTMFSVLKEYMAEEGAKVSEDALEYICEISDGAMRDALSILDQCISFYYEMEIDIDKVMEITGSVDKGVFFKLTEAMNESNSGLCMEIIDNVILQGRDISQFVADCITHFRNLLLAISIDGESVALDYSKEYVEKLKKQGQEIGYEYLLTLISSFSELANQIKFSQNPRILLEVCAIKGCNPVVSYDLGSVNKRLKNIEEKIENGNFIEKGTLEKEELKEIEKISQNSESVEKKEDVVEKYKEKIEKAIPEDIKNVISNWNSFVMSLEKDPVVRSVLSLQGRACYLEDECLTIVAKNNGAMLYLESRLEIISKELEKYFGKEYLVKIINEDKYKKRISEKASLEKEENKITRESFENTFGSFVQFED